ncbi:MAG: hypothetical protein LBD48_01165 [Treponema sp.]|nr:hypothetical protein [Treponema sp.]
MQTNKTRKNSTAGIIVASLCIVVYLAVLVSSAVRIFSSIDHRRDLALEEFNYIAGLTVSAGSRSFMDKTFVETINNALAGSNTLEGIIITGPNGEYAFEKERGKAVIWVNNSPRFRERFDFSRQPLYQYLHIQNLRNVYIEAKSSALDYVLLSGILKQGLIMVLIAVLMAFFTLLLEMLLSGRRRQTPEFETTPARSRPAAGEFGLPRTEADADKETFTSVPRVNTGWEEYAPGQLDTELHRCTAAGQDLVLITAKISSADKTFYNRFAAEAVHFFGLQDLIFERGERGLTIIYPNASLETGFARAGEFHSRLMAKYPLMLHSKSDLCMGLSSRAGRTVDSGRLLFEAGAALERAVRDPESPIVAFKSDPAKYHEFINRNR